MKIRLETGRQSGLQAEPALHGLTQGMRRVGSPRRDAHLRRNDPFPPRATQCVTQLPGTRLTGIIREKEINTESTKKRKVPAGFARKKKKRSASIIQSSYSCRFGAAIKLRGYKYPFLLSSLCTGCDWNVVQPASLKQASSGCPSVSQNIPLKTRMSTQYSSVERRNRRHKSS